MRSADRPKAVVALGRQSPGARAKLAADEHLAEPSIDAHGADQHRVQAYHFARQAKDDRRLIARLSGRIQFRIGLVAAGGPHKWARSRHAASVVFAFFLPMLTIARRVGPDSLS